MCNVTSPLETVFAAIDEANSHDPNTTADGARARVEGQLASDWLDRINPRASPPLRVAARAHHLRRWEIERDSYADGRAGYLRWRTDNKAHQAESAVAILSEHGWPPERVERVRELLLRRRLRTDAETQTLEDVACLVFLESQFSSLVARTPNDRIVAIVAKTLQKMSARAVTEAATIELDPSCRDVLDEAVALHSQRQD